MCVSYKGTIASGGIVTGKCLILDDLDLTPIERRITVSEAEDEIKKLHKAMDKAKAELEDLVSRQTEEEKINIFTAHISILEDPYFEETVLDKISKELQNAQKALSMGIHEISEQFLSLDDDYFKERVADFRDVANRVMRILKNKKEMDLSCLKEEVILAAHDLTPSQTASMDLDKILGFVTEAGGKTSHTAIMARSMDIPAIVGCQNLLSAISNDDYLVLDALEGQVVVNPPQEVLEEFVVKRADYVKKKNRLNQLIGCIPETLDGHVVEVAANAGNCADIKAAKEKGINGVGLFRTEFLYMEGTAFPTEEEQFNVYKQAAEIMEGKPVIIRTLDIGGDKELPYYKFHKELNPFLGHRAIRFCLDETQIFKTQLRAILRASAFGTLRIMFPMIISVEELRSAKELLQVCKKELDMEGIFYDKKIEVGMMIETPAAVAMADVFAKYVDFFSIGTNDLTQYMLAVDRGNEKIQKLYNSFHPAVLKSIHQVIEASHKAGKWTGMCGEFAGDEKAIPLLLGMGLDEFSMSASSVLSAKDLIRSVNYDACKQIAKDVLALETLEEIEIYLNK